MTSLSSCHVPRLVGYSQHYGEAHLFGTQLHTGEQKRVKWEHTRTTIRSTTILSLAKDYEYKWRPAKDVCLSFYTSVVLRG